MKQIQTLVNEDKWKRFKMWCINNNTTIKKKLDEFLDQFEEE